MQVCVAFLDLQKCKQSYSLKCILKQPEKEHVSEAFASAYLYVKEYYL